ncbi:MAG: YlxR family protein [Ruminococcaceae bacterium]|nr:YlxR family protein [Oscillospiraceae bacterium]
MAAKKIPMRMCTGCREMKPKKELVRVVKTTENEVKLDLTGKLNGRGAYICKNKECLAKAQKTNALSRAFEMAVSEEIYNQLETELGNIE